MPFSEEHWETMEGLLGTNEYIFTLFLNCQKKVFCLQHHTSYFDKHTPELDYWLNYWHTCGNKGTSGFTSNTLLVAKLDQLVVEIVYRYNKNNDREG